MEMRLRVIAYDVACDRRRRQMEKLACRYAVRVQGSVLEGWLTDSQVAELLRKAAPLIQPPTDSLRVYRFCAGCGQDVETLGISGSPMPPPEDVIS